MRGALPTASDCCCHTRARRSDTWPPAPPPALGSRGVDSRSQPHPETPLAPTPAQISSRTQISEIDTLMYFKPFLSIIQSEQTSGKHRPLVLARSLRSRHSDRALTRHCAVSLFRFVLSLCRHRHPRGAERGEQVHPLRFPLTGLRADARSTVPDCGSRQPVSVPEH